MFAGGRRRSSNNVRAMQLFHELKQQFPTIPDHVVTACIANNDQRPADHVLREVLEAASTLQQELMGRNPTDQPLSPTPDTPDQQQQNEPNNKTSKPSISKNINHTLNNLGIDHKLSKRKTLERTTKENLNHQIDSPLGVQKNTFKNKDSENLDHIKENLEYSKDTKETTNRNLKTKNVPLHKKSSLTKSEHTSKEHQHKSSLAVKTEEPQLHKIANVSADNSNLCKSDKLGNNQDTIEEILPFHRNTISDKLNISGPQEDSHKNTSVPRNSLLIGKGFSTFDKNLLLGKRDNPNYNKKHITEENQALQKNSLLVHQNNLENHKLLKNHFQPQKEIHVLKEELGVQHKERLKDDKGFDKDADNQETSKDFQKDTSSSHKESNANLRRRREKYAGYKESASDKGRTVSKYAYRKQPSQAESNNSNYLGENQLHKRSTQEESSNSKFCDNQTSFYNKPSSKASHSQSSHYNKDSSKASDSQSSLYNKHSSKAIDNQSSLDNKLLSKASDSQSSLYNKHSLKPSDSQFSLDNKPFSKASDSQSSPHNKHSSKPSDSQSSHYHKLSLKASDNQSSHYSRHSSKASDSQCSLYNKHSSRASDSQSSHHQRLRTDMNQSESDLNRNIIPKSEPADPKKLPPPPKRPDTLDLKSDHESTDSSCRIQQSEKCNNLFKLLHSNKPPKSPGTPKRLLNKPSPQRSSLVKLGDSSDKKTETVETPTQTTNTLAENPPNLNLSLNVNYSVGVVPPKHTTALHVVPQQPWIPDLASPRSFTSVNLTLRPPSSEPQPPIDITSQNSSLTYSTSTFDSQKGLQSKLQITVSPTGGCVSSIRTRPRSYHSGDTPTMELLQQQQRIGSVQDLSISPTIRKQQARIDKLRIELRLENMRLVALQGEVQKLEAVTSDVAIERTDAELEKQLLREIRHLRGQCERLTVDVDRQTENGVPLGETSEEFYRNIYTGQRGPFNFGLFDQRMTTTSSSNSSGRNRLQQQPTATLPQSENFGPKWSCSVCTFQNHPLLDSCEQCDMARIVQGTPKPPDLSYLLNMQASLKPKQIVTAANNLLQHVTNNANPEYLRRHSEGVRENRTLERVVDTPASPLNNTH